MKKIVFIFFSLIIAGFSVYAEEKMSSEFYKALKTDDVSKVISLYGDKFNANEPLSDNGVLPLNIAVQFGALDIVRFLIKNGADISAVDGDGRQAIHMAAMSVNSETIKLLVDAGADPDCADGQGLTPVCYAVRMGNLNAVRKLEKMKVNFRIETNLYRNLFFLCADGKFNREIAEIILKKGINVNIKDSFGNTPLHRAVYTDNIYAANWFLAQGADINAVNNYGETPLATASSSAALFLVKNGADINVKNRSGDSPVFKSLNCNDPAYFNELVRRNADLTVTNTQGQNALAYYININRYRDIDERYMKPLLSSDCVLEPINNNGDTILHYIADKGKYSYLEMISEKNVKKIINLVNKNYESPLHDVIKRGNNASDDRIKILKKFIEYGADIEIKSQTRSYYNSGITPLGKAVIENNFQAVKILLDAGSDINTVDSHGKSLLFYTIENSSEEILSELLERGSNINTTDSDSMTLLMYAVKKSDYQEVTLLCEKGAEINSENRFGKTALDYSTSDEISSLLKKNGATKGKGTKLVEAARKNNFRMVNKILLSGANVSTIDESSGMSVLSIAAENGNDKICRILLEKGADPNLYHKGKSNPPIYYAVQKKRYSTVKILVSYNAMINYDRSNLITETVSGRDIKMLKLLIPEEIKPEDYPFYGESPVMSAVKSGDTEILKILLEHGFSPDWTGKQYSNTPLIEAVKDGKNAIADMLLNYGADADLSGEYSYTALNYAVFHKDISLVKKLLKIKNRKDGCDWVGLNPFYHAVNTDSIEIVQSFLDAGYDINMLFEWRDDCPETALQLAAEKGSFEMLKFLIDNNADVNFGLQVMMSGEETVYTRNALYFAVNNDSNLKMVKYLVSKGCLPDYKYISGESPLLLSAYYGSSDICAYLYSLGVRHDTVSDNYGGLLEAACHGGVLWLIKEFVESGADINRKIEGKVPLIEASESGKKEVVKYLIENGADTNIRTEYESPLIKAVENGFAEITGILLENNADPDRPSENGTYFPILQAVKYGSFECLKLLIAKGADINIVDADGNNALHICFSDIPNTDGEAEKKRIIIARKKMMKFLIKNGIDYRHLNSSGSTASDIGYSSEFEDEKEIIRKMIDDKK